MIDLSVPVEEIAEHVKLFFPSLKQFPELYLHLFNHESKIIEPHFAYICPLCFHNIILLDPIFQIRSTSDFSLDHYPPKSVARGYLFSVLTCKDCNNKAGHNYDYALKKKMQEIAFKNKIPGAKIQATAKYSDVTGFYPSEFIIDQNGELQVSIKPNEKIHAPYLDDFMKNHLNNLNWKAEMTIKSIDDKIVSKALLKAAYLICFEMWGYSFAVSENAGRIREMLAGKMEYPIKNIALWNRENIKFDKDVKFPLGLCYIQNPKECRVFVLNIMLVDKETGFKTTVSVLIPNPTSEGWEDLKRIENILEQNISNQLVFDHVKDTWIGQGELDGYNRSWQKIIEMD